MTVQLQVPLGGPIALVPAQRLPERLQDLRLRFPYVPDLPDMHAELRTLAANGGVPARVEDGRLVVYGENYFLSLEPSTTDDCYTVHHVDRLRCQDHDRLAKGVLRLCSPDWQLVDDRPGGGYTTHWQPIQQAWQDLGAATRPDQAMPAYLDQVDQQVETAAERHAVSILRSGNSVNPALLPVLVDGEFTAFGPDTSPRPGSSLDSGQAAAVAKARTVPDVLLVHGPPGTGVSRTIAEIARESAARGEQVLVTSDTDRAVDDVLAKLPDELLAVRIGNEDSPAADLQRQVLADCADIASRLDTLVANDRIERWLALVGTEVYRAHRGQADVVKRTGLLTEADKRVVGPAAERVAALGDLVRDRSSTVRRCTDVVNRRQERAETKNIPGVHRWQAGRLTDARQRLADAVADQAEATTELAAATAELDGLRASYPELMALRVSITEAAGERDAALHAVTAAHAEIEHLTSGLVESPAVAEDDLAGWTEYLNWCRIALPLLLARADLLREWRAALHGPREPLYPELARYADIVAATSDLVPELEFDMAIVAEAARLSLPNVLIPLVRAKRAVLVGDHMRRPAGSAFESLIGVAPESHVVRLETQRRMPKVVADFVSARFYDNRLHTPVDHGQHDPRFTSALAMVDTSDLPVRVRAERGEYENQTEAKLITALVAGAHRAGRSWAAIVPYPAQVALLRNETDLVEDNVGTVDELRGGPRDLIVYGCTRSNAEGEVGVLSDLRGFNAAITMARQQLVVVGDLATLTNAADDGVRDLMTALVAHTREHGQLLRSSAVLDGRIGP
jgi:hypothetical protein